MQASRPGIRFQVLLLHDFYTTAGLSFLGYSRSATTTLWVTPVLPALLSPPVGWERPLFPPDGAARSAYCIGRRTVPLLRQGSQHLCRRLHFASTVNLGGTNSNSPCATPKAARSLR